MTLLRRTPGRTYRWDALYEQSRCHYQCWLAELPALWRLIRQTQYCISTPSFNSHPSTHKLLSEPICPSPTPRPPARPRSPIAQRASKQAAAPSSSTRARIEKAILYSFSPLWIWKRSSIFETCRDFLRHAYMSSREARMKIDHTSGRTFHASY